MPPNWNLLPPALQCVNIQCSYLFVTNIHDRRFPMHLFEATLLICQRAFKCKQANLLMKKAKWSFMTATLILCGFFVMWLWCLLTNMGRNVTSKTTFYKRCVYFLNTGSQYDAHTSVALRVSGWCWNRLDLYSSIVSPVSNQSDCSKI